MQRGLAWRKRIRLGAELDVANANLLPIFSIRITA